MEDLKQLSEELKRVNEAVSNNNPLPLSLILKNIRIKYPILNGYIEVKYDGRKEELEYTDDDPDSWASHIMWNCITDFEDSEYIDVNVLGPGPYIFELEAFETMNSFDSHPEMNNPEPE